MLPRYIVGTVRRARAPTSTVLGNERSDRHGLLHNARHMIMAYHSVAMGDPPESAFPICKAQSRRSAAFSPLPSHITLRMFPTTGLILEGHATVFSRLTKQEA